MLSGYGLFAQNQSFKHDPKDDSLWVLQVMNEHNNIFYKNTDEYNPQWSAGKVIYSPDYVMRLCNIVGTDPYNRIVYATKMQYVQNGKVIENYLSDGAGNYIGNTDIKHIYMLPNNQHYYLLTGYKFNTDYEGVHDWLDDFLAEVQQEPNHLNINSIAYHAAIIALGKDSTSEDEGMFRDDSWYSVISEKGYQSDEISLTSLVRVTNGELVSPYFMYDTVTHELRFRLIECPYENENRQCESPYVVLKSGMFKFNKNGFDLIKDSVWIYPPLKTTPDTMLIKDYQAGKYHIRAIATQIEKELQRGDVYPILTVYYVIDSTHVIEFYDYELGTFEEKDSIYVNPDYTILPDSSIVFFTTSTYNAYGPGMCGACSYYNSNFWYLKGDELKKVFSISTNTGTNIVSYAYKDGEKLVENFFYVLDDPNADAGEISFSEDGWDSSFAYVFSANGFGYKRKYYLNFDSKKDNPAIRFVVGDLIKSEEE